MKNKLLWSVIFLYLYSLNTFGIVNSPDISRNNSRMNTPFNEDWEFIKHDSISNWTSVKIPHTWNNIDMQVKKNKFFEGEALYKKSFIPDEKLKGKHVFIRFEGVATATEVYLNNSFVGNHFGAFSAFTLDITKFLKFGKTNEILVKVNNKSNPSIIPVNHVLFGVYGGIYRPVELIAVNPIHFTLTDYATKGVYISQKNVAAKSATLHFKAKLDNSTAKPANIELKTIILEKTGKIKLENSQLLSLNAQGRKVLEYEFILKNPHLWQGLEDPYLYKVKFQLIKNKEVLDEIALPLGVRSFEFKQGQGMFLNGRKIPMYGVCRHQDWWQLGSALGPENHDRDLELIREVGATTIRLAHYQQSEYFYSKCDSIGFLVWAEIPFVNKVTTLEANNAKQQLTELIRQNYHHPSIYIWGLHNEVYQPSNYVISLTKELNDLAKFEDPYRYTVQVSGYNKINQEVNNNADVQGINQYFGWYNGTIDSMKTWVERAEKEFPDNKVIFSEYGAEANVDLQKEVVSNRGDCCGFENDYNESFATLFHEVHWSVISSHPYLLASYIWNMFDFTTPMTAQGQVEARNMKGLVTFDRKTKKDPFFWYKANWSKEPVLYITQRRVVNRGNKITPIAIYSNGGVPSLFVNGKEILSYELGYSKVHYIFKDIELKEGENQIVAKVQIKGKSFEDKVIWNYSEDFKFNQNTPEIKQKEHIGL